MKYIWLIISLLSINPVSMAAQNQLKPADFAYGIPIETVNDDSIQRVVLPLTVYQNVTRDDLSDIAVFNRAGERVSHEIRAVAAAQKKRTYNLVFFPIFSDKNSSQAINLEFVRADDGSLIVKGNPNTQPDNMLTAYLVDTRTIKNQWLENVILTWEETDKTWINALKLLASNDLQNWIELPIAASVAQLNYKDEHILRNTIAINKVPYNYMLISANKSLDFQLEQLQAITVTQQDQPYDWFTIQANAKSWRQNEYEFHLPRGMSVSALDINLGKQANMIRVEVFSRNQVKLPWQRRTEAIIYNLMLNKQRLINQQLEFGSSRDSYWLIKMSKIPNDLTSLTVGWHPDELIFIADGNAPYTLAYGNANITKYQSMNMMSQMPLVKDISSAKLGKPFNLSGLNALKPAAKPIDYKVGILWGVLLLGVFFIARMVFILWKQMR